MEDLRFEETRSGNHYFTATIAGRKVKSKTVALQKYAEGFAKALGRSLTTQRHAWRLNAAGKWVVDLYSPRYVVIAHSEPFATQGEALAFLADIKKLAQ